MTLPLGDQPTTTRILWVSRGTQTLLEHNANLSVAGVIDEGIVIRDVDTGVVSVLDFAGSVVGLGLTARDAMIVPSTPLLLATTIDGSPRVFDIDTSDEIVIEGFDPLTEILQLATSPTQPQIAMAATNESGGVGLFVFDAADRMVRKLLDLDRHDVVAGFSGSGDAVALVTDGEQYGSAAVLVALSDGSMTNI